MNSLKGKKESGARTSRSKLDEVKEQLARLEENDKRRNRERGKEYMKHQHEVKKIDEKSREDQKQQQLRALREKIKQLNWHPKPQPTVAPTVKSATARSENAIAGAGDENNNLFQTTSALLEERADAQSADRLAHERFPFPTFGQSQKPKPSENVPLGKEFEFVREANSLFPGEPRRPGPTPTRKAHSIVSTMDSMQLVSKKRAASGSTTASSSTSRRLACSAERKSRSPSSIERTKKATGSRPRSDESLSRSLRSTKPTTPNRRYENVTSDDDAIVRVPAPQPSQENLPSRAMEVTVESDEPSLPMRRSAAGLSAKHRYRQEEDSLRMAGIDASLTSYASSIISGSERGSNRQSNPDSRLVDDEHVSAVLEAPAVEDVPHVRESLSQRLGNLLESSRVQSSLPDNFVAKLNLPHPAEPATTTTPASSAPSRASDRVKIPRPVTKVVASQRVAPLSYMQPAPEIIQRQDPPKLYATKIVREPRMRRPPATIGYVDSDEERRALARGSDEEEEGDGYSAAHALYTLLSEEQKKKKAAKKPPAIVQDASSVPPMAAAQVPPRRSASETTSKKHPPSDWSSEEEKSLPAESHNPYEVKLRHALEADWTSSVDSYRHADSLASTKQFVMNGLPQEVPLPARAPAQPSAGLETARLNAAALRLQLEQELQRQDELFQCTLELHGLNDMGAHLPNMLQQHMQQQAHIAATTRQQQQQQRGPADRRSQEKKKRKSSGYSSSDEEVRRSVHNVNENLHAAEIAMEQSEKLLQMYMTLNQYRQKEQEEERMGQMRVLQTGLQNLDTMHRLDLQIVEANAAQSAARMSTTMPSSYSQEDPVELGIAMGDGVEDPLFATLPVSSAGSRMNRSVHAVSMSVQTSPIRSPARPAASSPQRSSPVRSQVQPSISSSAGKSLLPSDEQLYTKYERMQAAYNAPVTLSALERTHRQKIAQVEQQHLNRLAWLDQVIAMNISTPMEIFEERRRFEELHQIELAKLLREDPQAKVGLASHLAVNHAQEPKTVEIQSEEDNDLPRQWRSERHYSEDQIPRQEDEWEEMHSPRSSTSSSRHRHQEPSYASRPSSDDLVAQESPTLQASKRRSYDQKESPSKLASAQDPRRASSASDFEVEGPEGEDEDWENYEYENTFVSESKASVNLFAKRPLHGMSVSEDEENMYEDTFESNVYGRSSAPVAAVATIPEEEEVSEDVDSPSRGYRTSMGAEEIEDEVKFDDRSEEEEEEEEVEEEYEDSAGFEEVEDEEYREDDYGAVEEEKSRSMGRSHAGYSYSYDDSFIQISAAQERDRQESVDYEDTFVSAGGKPASVPTVRASEEQEEEEEIGEEIEDEYADEVEEEKELGSDAQRDEVSQDYEASFASSVVSHTGPHNDGDQYADTFVSESRASNIPRGHAVHPAHVQEDSRVYDDSFLAGSVSESVAPSKPTAGAATTTAISVAASKDDYEDTFTGVSEEEEEVEEDVQESLEDSASQQEESRAADERLEPSILASEAAGGESLNYTESFEQTQLAHDSYDDTFVSAPAADDSSVLRALPEDEDKGAEQISFSAAEPHASPLVAPRVEKEVEQEEDEEIPEEVEELEASESEEELVIVRSSSSAAELVATREDSYEDTFVRSEVAGEKEAPDEAEATVAVSMSMDRYVDTYDDSFTSESQSREESTSAAPAAVLSQPNNEAVAAAAAALPATVAKAEEEEEDVSEEIEEVVEEFDEHEDEEDHRAPALHVHFAERNQEFSPLPVIPSPPEVSDAMIETDDKPPLVNESAESDDFDDEVEQVTPHMLRTVHIPEPKDSGDEQEEEERDYDDEDFEEELEEASSHPVSVLPSPSKAGVEIAPAEPVARPTDGVKHLEQEVEEEEVEEEVEEELLVEASAAEDDQQESFTESAIKPAVQMGPTLEPNVETRDRVGSLEDEELDVRGALQRVRTLQAAAGDSRSMKFNPEKQKWEGEDDISLTGFDDSEDNRSEAAAHAVEHLAEEEEEEEDGYELDDEFEDKDLTVLAESESLPAQKPDMVVQEVAAIAREVSQEVAEDLEIDEEIEEEVDEDEQRDTSEQISRPVASPQTSSFLSEESVDDVLADALAPLSPSPVKGPVLSKVVEATGSEADQLVDVSTETVEGPLESGDSMLLVEVGEVEVSSFLEDDNAVPYQPSPPASARLPSSKESVEDSTQDLLDEVEGILDEISQSEEPASSLPAELLPSTSPTYEPPEKELPHEAAPSEEEEAEAITEALWQTVLQESLIEVLSKETVPTFPLVQPSTLTIVGDVPIAELSPSSSSDNEIGVEDSVYIDLPHEPAETKVDNLSVVKPKPSLQPLTDVEGTADKDADSPLTSEAHTPLVEESVNAQAMADRVMDSLDQNDFLTRLSASFVQPSYGFAQAAEAWLSQHPAPPSERLVMTILADRLDEMSSALHASKLAASNKHLWHERNLGMDRHSRLAASILSLTSPSTILSFLRYKLRPEMAVFPSSRQDEDGGLTAEGYGESGKSLLEYSQASLRNFIEQECDWLSHRVRDLTQQELDRVNEDVVDAILERELQDALQCCR